MRTKRSNKKKLSLCKVTIARLHNREQDAVKGKDEPPTGETNCTLHDTCPKPVNTIGPIESCDLICIVDI
ncbi:MAG: hypothetical protein GY940_23240 [bacterium]|nr:hypothetical protein [bacterium]